MRIVVRRCPVLALVLALTTLCAFAAFQTAHAETRGAECYSAWDDYYFYAAFQVDDPHVNSVNTTPLSQPQQDDDVEVFFNTNGSAGPAGRPVGTYQMAVSAGNGGYFSTGDASGKAKPKLVFTYKYDATVDGTLNKNDDTDIGYTIELAIPWQELGLTGPPKPGTVWGFNVINRDRSSATKPADHLASLSAAVQGASDVQNSKLWTKITFTNSLTSEHSGPDMVYCPHVEGHFPIVDGVIRSGEYFRADGFSLGAPTMEALAPTAQEEPNVNMTADQAFQQAIAATPPPTLSNGNNAGSTGPDDSDSSGSDQSSAPVAPAAPATPPPAAPPSTTSSSSGKPGAPAEYDIELPGGGTLHIGKMPPPPVATEPLPAYEPPVPPPSKHGHGKGGSKEAQLPNGMFGPQFPAVGPNVNPDQALRLLDQTDPSSLFVALYRPDFAPGEAFVDQPISGAGPWFGGGSVQYQIDQAKDARRAGVDVLLVEYDPSDPQANGALLSLVQALQEMRRTADDYPLLGLYLKGSTSDPYAAVHSFFERVPPAFRGEVYLPDAQANKPEYIAVLPNAADPAGIEARFAKDFAGEGAGLFVAEPSESSGVTSSTPNVALTSAVVTPVADPTKPVSDRDQGASFNSAWGAANTNKTDWALLDSWNDYARGTDVTSTRQYGEHYADLTKLYSAQWSGGKEWSARYLKCNAPAVMSPNSLYTVQVRVENVGTLPWRLGEDYGLSYRWYKDGRLYDDSAPKIPVINDIYPGQSTTIGVGILPHNQYGNPIEEGDYTLVFDMVQGDNRWFTLAGDIGLKVHIHVLAAGDASTDGATFINSTLPTRVQNDARYTAVITVRNDTSATWKAGETKLEYSADPEASANTAPVTGGSTIASDVLPGAVAKVSVPVKISGSDGTFYTVKWTVHNPDVAGHLTQGVSTTPADDGASFVLNDIPRSLKAGDTTTGRLGLVNRGTLPWTPGSWQVGYYWAYLDGTLVHGDNGLLTPINETVQPDEAAAVTAKFKAPDYPGRYFLVWDVRDPQGRWSSEYGQKMHPGATLPVMVSVSDSGASRAKFVDLSKQFNVTAAGFEGAQTGDFDAEGDTIPGEQLPPDGTNDTVSNPLLTPQPGPSDYPSGFYVGIKAADHNIAFHYPDDKTDSNAVACQGQRIGLPNGFTSIHLLAAATGSDTDTATFTVDGQAQSLNIAPWTTAPADASIGLQFSYHLHSGVVDTSTPTVLGDYVIRTPNGARSLTLPKDTNIKILAITVAR